jgi:hypothetical protein
VVSHAALLAVVTANAGALRELRLWSPSDGLDDIWLQLRADEVEQLLRAAPLLRLFEAAVQCSCEDASRVLRNDPPFGPKLRVRLLALQRHRHREGPIVFQTPDEAAVLAAIADASRHASLREVAVSAIQLRTPAALDALVDAALARSLSSVWLEDCAVAAGAAPALARLLHGGWLARLLIDGPLPLDVPGALVLGNALRTSTPLTSLRLCGSNLWGDPAVGRQLLALLTGHPSLRDLDLSFNDAREAGTPAAQAAMGFPLAALVAANAPALRRFGVTGCNLGDAGLLPLVEALPHNTHLRELQCAFNGITEDFARKRLLPALQANASLRELDLVGGDPAYDPHTSPDIIYALQDMVAARGTAGALP